MIAHFGLIRSSLRVFAHDVDGRTGNARLVAAHGTPAGKQTAVVHRRGNSRTTTYYTSRSLSDARRPIVAESQGVIREEEADVGSASVPSPIGDLPSTSLSVAHDETSSSAKTQQGTSRVSVEGHLQPSPISRREEVMKQPIQNTQGTHVQLYPEGTGTKAVVCGSDEGNAAATGIKQHHTVADCKVQGTTAHQMVTRSSTLKLNPLQRQCNACSLVSKEVHSAGPQSTAESAETANVAARAASTGDAMAQSSHAGDLRDGGGSDAMSLASFLCDRGFSGLQAERLALELHGENSQFTCISALEQQMQRLESILPCMDIRALVVKDSLVLNVDASTAARRLVFLSSRLGHPDLTQLIKTAPQLLYAEEVEERLDHCMDKLLSLLPDDYPLDSLQKLLVEAPTIIFRMDYYVSAACLNDLPADLLNQLNTIRGGPHDTSCMI